MRNGSRARARAVVLFAAMSLVGSIFALSGSAAGAPKSTKEFTANIAPSCDTVNRNDSPYVLTITNSTTSGITLGSANVTVPSGYTDVKGFSVTAPAGKTWTAALVSGVIELRAVGGPDKLNPGEAVVLQFTADTPSTTGTREWTSEAKPSTDFGGGSFFTLLGSQPAVQVVTSCGKLVITSITDDETGLEGFAQLNKTFTAVVQAQDANDDPLPVGSDTVVTLAATTGTGTLGGTKTGTIPAGQSTVTFSDLTYNKVETFNLRASAAGFDNGNKLVSVLAKVTPFSGTTQGLISTCEDATPQNPKCVNVDFHNGTGNAGFLAQGSCEGFPGAGTCPTNDSLVWVIGDFTDASGNDLYTNTDPLFVDIECDKTICGQKGVPQFTIFVQLRDGDPFVESPACPSKGTIAPGDKFCTDYVSSKRDNAGDTHMIVLFTSDPRMR